MRSITEQDFLWATKGGFYPQMKNHQVHWWIFIVFKLGGNYFNKDMIKNIVNINHFEIHIHFIF